MRPSLPSSSSSTKYGVGVGSCAPADARPGCTGAASPSERPQRAISRAASAARRSALLAIDAYGATTASLPPLVAPWRIARRARFEALLAENARPASPSDTRSFPNGTAKATRSSFGNIFLPRSPCRMPTFPKSCGFTAFKTPCSASLEKDIPRSEMNVQTEPRKSEMQGTRGAKKPAEESTSHSSAASPSTPSPIRHARCDTRR